MDTTGAHGGVVVGGINGIYDPDLYAYQIGNPAQLMQKVDFGGTSNTVGEYGVAISPDGFSAYALTRGTGTQVLLNLVSIPTPPPPTAPDPPFNVTATAGHGSATVLWSRPLSDGRSPLTGYTVTASPGGFSVATAPSVTTALISPLTNGTTYTFTVTATNAYGTSAPSAPSPAVTPGAPSAPLSVVAVD